MDLRFETPLFTVSEAAHIVGVHSTTFSRWTKGYSYQPTAGTTRDVEPVIALASGTDARTPQVSFIALAEAFVLNAVRRSGVPMQRVRPALVELENKFGIDHALASERLYTDGAEILFDYAESHKTLEAEAEAIHQLVVIRNGQRVFTEVVKDYLTRIQYGSDGWAGTIFLPGYRNNSVVVDPQRAFGQPTFVNGGTRVSDVLQRFWAGEDLADLADDYGVPVPDLEDAVRVASQPAA